MTKRTHASWGRDAVWLLVAFGGLYFLLLGQLPLANPDEGRYAQIPREMAAAGDWAMGRLNGIPYFEKPPLAYWFIGTAQKIFGVSEWVARLMPTLCGLAGVVLAYAAARRIYGRGAGIGAAVVLGTSLLYFGLARLLLLDMTLTLLMSASLFCFILGVKEAAGAKRRWLFHGVYAAAALATLTKGLIGFLIPGAVMFFWLLIFNQWRRLRPFYLPTGTLLFLAIAAPWHIVASQRHPAWTEFYFVHEHWNRFTEADHGRTEPWWFFAPVFVVGFFPWIGFLGAAVRDGVGGGRKAVWAGRDENADTWFFVTWAGFVFLFFNVSQSKLMPYILPMFPAVSVLVGTWLARRWADGVVERLRFGFGVFSFICGVLGIGALVMVLKPGAIEDATQAAALRPLGFVLAAVTLTGGVLAPWATRVWGVAAGVKALLATTAGLLLVIIFAAPDMRRADTKELAAVVRERAKPEDRVYTFWAFFHDFLYYVERPVDLVSYVDEMQVQFLEPEVRARRFINDVELRRQMAGPVRVWVALRKRDLEHFHREVGRSYHLIAEGRGHYLLSNQP